MARFTSFLLSEARGSIGGLTLTKAGMAANVMRVKRYPARVFSSLQTLTQTRFGGLSQRWKNLTTEQKRDWKDYANTLLFSNATGSFVPDARTAFLQVLMRQQDFVAKGYGFTTSSDLAPTVSGVFTYTDIKVDKPTTVGIGFSIKILQVSGENMAVLVGRNKRPQNGNGAAPKEVILEEYIIQQVPTGAETEFEFLNLVLGDTHDVVVRGIGDDAPHRFANTVTMEAVAQETII